MKLLNEATAGTMIRLGDIECETRKLLSELDSLDVRLHRAFEAVCIASFVAYLNVERKRILEDEKRAKTSASLASFRALGIYGLFSLFSGQKPNWNRAVRSVFREESFEDVRIAASSDAIKVVNVSKMARERNMTVAGVVAYLEGKGNKVLSWPEFEARAKNLRMAALKGKVTLLDKEEATLEGVSALTARASAVPIGHLTSGDLPCSDSANVA